MTLMLILGAVAAFYCLLLLFRCATFALPVFAGLGLWAWRGSGIADRSEYIRQSRDRLGQPS